MWIAGLGTFKDAGHIAHRTSEAQFGLQNNEIRGRDLSVTDLNTMRNKFLQMQQMMRKVGKFQEMVAYLGGELPRMIRR